MSNKLYNILVPVDFTTKNKWAIAKAIELSNSFHCNVHLVYVTGQFHSPFHRRINTEAALVRLTQLKAEYKQQLCGEGSLEITVLTGNRFQQLTNYILQYEMDLVI